MNAYLASTDPDWFRFLSDRAVRSEVDEVNFWMPKPWGGNFRVLHDGQPLLFKLRRPHNAVAGGGFFKHYWEIPLSIAWDSFGWKNGAESHLEVWRRIKRLRREHPRPGDDPVIGCILLVEPFFWHEDLWIHDPPGWQKNIQRGRTYDLSQGEGHTLWSMVMDRMAEDRRRRHPGAPATELTLFGGYSDPALRPMRLGQGTFRALVTDTYRRECAVTRERALPALDAAHIRPFSEVQGHSVRNGLLLRSDVHRLFDAGYLTVTPEHRVEASTRMREDFDDGDNYLRLHGAEVWVPPAPEFQPDPDALRWHNEERFRG